MGGLLKKRTVGLKAVTRQIIALGLVPALVLAGAYSSRAEGPEVPSPSWAGAEAVSAVSAALAGRSAQPGGIVEAATKFSHLSETELATVFGQGVQPRAPSDHTGGVVLWDERPAGPPVTTHHISTGPGGTQISTVSVGAR